MKKSIFALVFAAQAALWVAAVSAQGMDTMAKIQSSGKVVMGTRESSTPIAYLYGRLPFAKINLPCFDEQE